MIIIPQKRRVRLNACPVGLFLHGQTLAVMTEYFSYPNLVYQRDAYLVESGEYFWGGTKTTQDRAKLLVNPCIVAGETDKGWTR